MPLPTSLPPPATRILTATAALLTAALAPAAAASSAPAAAPFTLPDKVEFNRDIRPIMSDTCFHCHGFDAKTREAGLRLDVREDALKKTKNDVIPIVPGKPEESEIYHRIVDADDPMPPEKAHKPLTARQKALFKRWIEQGAVYEPHWAYAELKRPAVPALNSQPSTLNSSPNAVDAFIRASLAEKKITPSPAAGPARLLRRLSLDLTGLPPTPDEVAQFERASARDPEGAYRAAVDRLLASPHYGERMAVWWLDVARFADTVGFHGDQNQRIFPYRDWVIDAFNTNKPFDQFTVEQLAGDLLPNPTPAQLVATGYNRLNMMTREGGAQPKEYLAKYGAERVRSVSAAWFGSTFGCAECHDHKFDPIKASDFYELQAFFADVKQWGVYANYGYTPEPELEGVNNDSPFPPELAVESPYLKKRYDRTRAELDAVIASLRTGLSAAPATAPALAAWESAAARFRALHPDGWAYPEPTAQVLRNNRPAADRNAVVSADWLVSTPKALGRGESLEVTLEPGDLRRVAALRIEVDPSAPDDAVLNKAFTVALSVVDAKGKARKLAFAAGEATARRPLHVGGAEVFGLGNQWRLPRTRPAGPLRGTWLLAEPVDLAPGEKLLVSLGGEATAPLRLSFSPLSALDPLAVADSALLAALAVPSAQRTPAQAAAVLDAWHWSTVADRNAYDAGRRLFAAARDLDGGRTWTLVTQPVAPLPVRVLARGNWQDETGPLVGPATPSFLPARRESTLDRRLTRLDLARWIVSKENPLTARAVTNRLWQQFFGTGLSAAVDDLGSQGELPSHPALLDWLAVEFRDGGWDFKQLVRLLVTSATYRQSASLRPELREVDPANRLLASQNPRRLDAEFIRDQALFVAGILDLSDIGGPSVKPYQPDGYYDQLQFPDRKYIASTGPEQWRRGVYMHWQRTFLHPMLANFDAPARDECAALRTQSNTPQQALTLLNDPTFVEAARLFAARLLADSSAPDDAARLRRAYALALARAPQPKELASLTAFLATQREHYRANPAEAKSLGAVGLKPASAAADPVDLAAWTHVCRVLLNTQESLTRY